MSIEYNKGVTLISRKPLKESEMTEERQYHRKSARAAESRAKDKKEHMAKKFKLSSKEAATFFKGKGDAGKKIVKV